MSEENEIAAKAYNKWQLAELYNVGERTFNEWIKPFNKEIGKQVGKKYTPKQVKIIFELLGTP